MVCTCKLHLKLRNCVATFAEGHHVNCCLIPKHWSDGILALQPDELRKLFLVLLDDHGIT